MNSDTPKVDAAVWQVPSSTAIETLEDVVSADFARQLERELNEAQPAIDHYKAWKNNSSLEEWFPITAEELHTLRARVKELEADGCCEWSLDSSEEFHNTGCGQAYQFIADGIKENKAKYCIFCGKLIVDRQAIDAAMKGNQ